MQIWAFIWLRIGSSRELNNICHHHPKSKKRKSSEGNSGSIHPHGRCGNTEKTSKTISTIAIQGHFRQEGHYGGGREVHFHWLKLG